MSGCPYLKYSWKKDCEVCLKTDKPTNADIKCDFGYEDCKTYAQCKGKKIYEINKK